MTDYPLISKSRGATAFKKALQGFFTSLVQTIAQSGVLYNSPELMENIHAWISALSSAGNRPFRHTSTVVSLAITGALCDVAADIVESVAKKNRQKETEAKKARPNKGRVTTLEKEVQELEQKLETVDASISDWFSTVYVHRFRDVHHTIRVECVEALGEWIMVYSDKFFDGEHLRYLGWVLSDPNPATRAETLKQLQRLFRDKSKLAGLKTFTERFRPRIVEMATQDAETNVRAAAVQLLDILREAGLLEPDDVDTVGKLVFDSEPKVRKAVVGFFAETINAAYEQHIEDMGGQEAISEALDDPDEDEEQTHPRLEWLKLKCLVEQLLAYETAETDLPTQIERIGSSGTNYSLIAAGIESSFFLATQALYDAVPEIRSWEVLAGYLLHDHSQTPAEGGEDVQTVLKQTCKLEDKEETILLDVLAAAVKTRLQHLADAQKDKKKTKTEKQALKEEHAEMVKQLSNVIPQLLKKFGAVPEAASLCLRLERQLDLDIFQELRQTAALGALLDDVNRQFLSHTHEHVLEEAVESILHALSNEETQESAEAKVQGLWESLIDTFNAIRGERASLSTRGTLDSNSLTALTSIALRISKLAKISEPAILDVPSASSNQPKSRKGPAIQKLPPIISLLQILDRGLPSDDTDMEVDAEEDMLARHTMNAVTFYFAWKCRDIAECIQKKQPILEETLEHVASRRDACIKSLTRIMESRRGADDVRLEAAYVLLDISNMFYSLQNVKAKAQAERPQNGETAEDEEEDGEEDWRALCQKIDAPTTKLLVQILGAAEANLAKRTKRQVEEPDVDDDPIDPDDEPESSDDEDEEDAENVEGMSPKAIRILMATGRLCFLGSRMVHGVRVGTLGEDVRKRLERNKFKLGNDWKEVVNHLNDAGEKGTGPKPQRSKPAAAKAAPKPKATPKAKATPRSKPASKKKGRRRNFESEDEDEEEISDIEDEEDELEEEENEGGELADDAIEDD